MERHRQRLSGVEQLCGAPFVDVLGLGKCAGHNAPRASILRALNLLEHRAMLCIRVDEVAGARPHQNKDWEAERSAHSSIRWAPPSAAASAASSDSTVASTRTVTSTYSMNETYGCGPAHESPVLPR